MAIPVAREERAKYFNRLRDQAMKTRLAMDVIADYGRRLYAGETNLVLRSGLPAPNDNQFRKVNDQFASRLGDGDPRAMVKPRFDDDRPYLGGMADELSERLAVVYDREKLSDDLIDGQVENGYAGISYIEVRPDFTIDHLSYWDGYGDNTHGRAGHVAKSHKYFFVRRSMDVEEFVEKYRKKLKSADITEIPIGKDGFAKDTGEQIPGRSMAGAYVLVDTGAVMVPSEQSTNKGNIGASWNYPQEDLYIPDQTKIWFWEAWVKDRKSKTGWRHVLMYDDKIFHEDEWYAFFDGPQIFALRALRVAGQFYQPSEAVQLIGTQIAINLIAKRGLDNMQRVEDPDHFVDERTMTMNDPEGEGLSFSGGHVYKMSQNGHHSETEPQELGASFYQLRAMLQQQIASTVGMGADIHTGSTDESNVKSGVAIQQLRSEASQLLNLRKSNQNRVLGGIAKALCHLILEEELTAARKNAVEYILDLRMPGYRLQFDDEQLEELLDQVEPPEELVVSSIDPSFLMPDGTPLDHWTIENTFDFRWEINANLQHEEEMEIFLLALQQARLLVPEDQILQFELAADISQQKRPAEMLRITYENRLRELGIDPNQIALTGWMSRLMMPMMGAEDGAGGPPSNNGGPPSQNSNGKAPKKEKANA